MERILPELLILQSGYGSRDRRTDGRTDRRTDGRSETNIPPNNFVVRGVKILKQYREIPLDSYPHMKMFIFHWIWYGASFFDRCAKICPRVPPLNCRDVSVIKMWYSLSKQCFLNNRDTNRMEQIGRVTPTCHLIAWNTPMLLTTRWKFGVWSYYLNMWVQTDHHQL